MSGPPRWAKKALGAVTGISLLLLLIQYLLGLWTADYAPAAFTNDTSFPSLDWHYNVGFALGIVSILIVILAALTRQARLIAPSVVLFIAILVAGVLGMRYVNTTPNDPLASFGMGVMFLVAFGSAMSIVTQLRPRLGWAPMAGDSGAPTF
jgi:hypothetical protein